MYAGIFFVELVLKSYERLTKKRVLYSDTHHPNQCFYGPPQITGMHVAPHSLLIAVICGLVLAAIGFIYQYARVSVIRDVLSGQDFQPLCCARTRAVSSGATRKTVHDHRARRFHFLR